MKFLEAAPAVLLASCLVGAACTRTDLATRDDEEKRAAIERMYDSYKESFPDVREVTVEQLLAMQAESDVVLVDVREPEERAVSIIPGAISREVFESKIEYYRDKPVVTYCTIGYRSGLYTQTLQARGFDAYNLRGSILTWVHAGQPVVDGHGPTHRLHVYGSRWNLAPDGYEAVW